MPTRKRFAVAALLLASSFCLGQEVSPVPVAGAEHLGKVSFPISCAPEVQQSLERGLALMHSFQYATAGMAFSQTVEEDPHCAMAYWGEAINLYHQLWDWPSPETLKRGRALLKKAAKNSPKTDREREYIHAAAIFYRKDKKLGRKERNRSYSDAMAKLFQHYPQDADAAALYALSLIPWYRDDSPEAKKKALDILEALFAREPQHPGAAHYLIHAADQHELASRGLGAARSYARIAPSSSHALHMPSHIFSHLGLWQDSINSNEAAVAAASEATRKNIDNESNYQIHAMQYLEYAYLQMGQDAHALQIADAIKDVPGIAPASIADDGSLLKALYILETHRWQDADQLDPQVPSSPVARMRVHLARTISEARSGKVDQAIREVEKLQAAFVGVRKHFPDALPDNPTVLEGQAWLAYAQGKADEAVSKMQAAIKAEDNSFSVDAAGLPAYELLGDLLLEMHQPAQALEAYESSLKEAPNRFNSIYGAGRSAELTDKQDQAQMYYAALVKIVDPQSGRPELAAAKAFLAKNQKSGSAAD
ncbi:MAG TPA: hypothetical protein VG488_12960 [Candidatus Angelobacter sp.]|nr:hypothetical protein [Candidatus Angelobacter sp.]